jgi:hypothetical protein
VAAVSGMTKRLLAYGAVVLAVAIIGYTLAVKMAGDEGPPGAGGPATGKASGIAPRRDAAKGAGPAVEPARAAGVRVVEVSGTATRATASGEVSPITAGQDLSVDDLLKTEPQSRLRLQIGDKSTVDLADKAEVEVRELSDSIQRLGLVYGRAVVDYREDGGRVLKIENRDGSAVAQVKAGKFSILSTGTTVAVATETGQVDLSAAGTTVSVGADQESIVSSGAPSRPLTVPAELVLRIVDPGCRVQREAFYTFSGRTSPGASVQVNQVQARVNERGDFSVRLPLKVGRNKIEVVSVDVRGRTERRVFPCITVDPGAPIKGVDIKWGGAGEGGG